MYFRPPSMDWDIDPNNLDIHRERYAAEVAYLREHGPEDLPMASAQMAMFDAAYRVLGSETPRSLRKRASLVVRCDDCSGRAIAWLAWVGGRPLFLGEERRSGGRVVVSLLDEPTFAAPHFCCRKATYVFGYDLDPEMPGPGGRRAQWRVVHADAQRIAYHEQRKAT